MKFVYFIILGLVIFNGCLIFTSSIFETSMDESATDYSSYQLKNPGDIINILTNNASIGAWGILTLAGIIAALALKNYIFIGVGIFLGLVTALYIGASSVLFNISDNAYVHSIITLIGIVIGILVLYNVVEMFTGQGGDV